MNNIFLYLVSDVDDIFKLWTFLLDLIINEFAFVIISEYIKIQKPLKY